MTVESAADRAAFYNPDEFGERIQYWAADGIFIDIVALKTSPERGGAFSGAVALDIHHFRVAGDVTSLPEQGGTLSLVATGETFEVTEPPRRSRDGRDWVIAAMQNGGC